jgi:hypothetical protein
MSSRPRFFLFCVLSVYLIRIWFFVLIVLHFVFACTYNKRHKYLNPGRIQTRNPNRKEAKNLRLRPNGHRHRLGFEAWPLGTGRLREIHRGYKDWIPGCLIKCRKSWMGKAEMSLLRRPTPPHPTPPRSFAYRCKLRKPNNQAKAIFYHKTTHIRQFWYTTRK